MDLMIKQKFSECKRRVGEILIDITDDDPEDSIWNEIVDLEHEQLVACDFIEKFLHNIHLSWFEIENPVDEPVLSDVSSHNSIPPNCYVDSKGTIRPNSDRDIK